MKSKVSTEINYISLINWFWENVPFLDGYKPDYGILFLAITDSINHNRWSENVPIPYDRITSKSCLSKRAYLDGRKWLKENKLIDFACGKNEYAMATFSLGSEVRNCTAANTAANTATDTAAVSSTAPLLTPLLAPSIINNKQETIKQETKIEKLDFELFWKPYPKKVAKSKCKDKWYKLPLKDQKAILEVLPKYLAYKPFATYNHPNPETFLNQKRWEDEIQTTAPAPRPSPHVPPPTYTAADLFQIPKNNPSITRHD